MKADDRSVVEKIEPVIGSEISGVGVAEETA
jgi:hypothetical protein